MILFFTLLCEWKNQNITAMKKALNKTALLLILLALTSSTRAGTLSQQYQNLSGNKRETMKNVLKALEEGHDYDSMPYWRENEYGFSHHIFDIPDFDFKWDFPEIRFNDEFIDDMEKKFEVMEERMQELLRELEEKLDSLNQRLSGKHLELV